MFVTTGKIKGKRCRPTEVSNSGWIGKVARKAISSQAYLWRNRTYL